ncbi:hypothetical protein KJ599_04945 [bacterium]|nr:hypothetical protein [bacterium]
MRKTEIIIKDLKSLISSKGYIYIRCMIIFEDFHINPEKIQELNLIKRLSHKEVSLLLGFLIQNQINFTPPDLWQDLIQMKQKTYELMEELVETKGVRSCNITKLVEVTLSNRNRNRGVRRTNSIIR